MTKKKNREKIMSDKDRIAYWKKSGRRCYYCYGKRPIDSITDRLFGCCSKCAELDAKEKIVRKTLPCILCKQKLKPSMIDEEITFRTADVQPLSGGMMGRISCGYGSTLDGNMYIIAICDKCTRWAKKEGRIVYVGNYIP